MNDPTTIPELIETQALHRGRKVALIGPESGEEYTYAEIFQISGKISNFLQNEKVQKGDRVVVALPNAPLNLLLILGIMRLGAVPVPVDSDIKSFELVAIASLCKAVMLIAPFFVGNPSNPLPRTCRLLTLQNKIRGETLFSSWPELHNFRADFREDSVHPEDPAILLHTSGTTRGPKLVSITHVYSIVRMERTRIGLGLDERLAFQCILPIAHGIFYPCLTSLYVGGTLVISPPFSLRSIPSFLSQISKFGVNTVHLVPPIVKILVGSKAFPSLSSHTPLRFLTCVSAPLDPEQIRLFEQRHGIPLLNCYGLKETGFIALSPHNPSERCLESVGKIIPGTVRITGHNGGILPVGKCGEVRFKAAAARHGFHYFCRNDLNRRAFRSGWFRTGDMGRLDGQGRLYLQGRIHNLIICNGRKVAPEEIERVLCKHPAVAEAAAWGYPDANAGEKVAACFVARDEHSVTGEELRAHCRRYLAEYKCPVVVRRVHAIPKSVLGKIFRQSLPSSLEKI